MAAQTIKLADNDSLMSRWVEASLVKWVTSGESEKTGEHLKRDLHELTAEFAGPSPTRIESVLAETAALSLITLRTFEARFMQAENKGGMTFANARHHLRKIEHAQRRLESSLKTLATVRRLAIPSLQVNVAHNQQVNNQVSEG